MLFFALIPIAAIVVWLVYQRVTPGAVPGSRRLMRGQSEETPALALTAVSVVVGVFVAIVVAVSLAVYFLAR